MKAASRSRPLLAVSLTLAASATVALWLRADDDTLPKAPPATRYDAMAERSPFTAPTAATPMPTPPPVAAGPHWWDQMVVTSLMDRGGVYYAAVVDHASTKRYLLELHKVDPDSQLVLSDVHWDDRLEQTTVTVSKGTETAPPLHFDASASSGTPVSPSMSMNGPASMQAPYTPPPRNALINPNTLPPGFTGTPPPPPPGFPPNVVRRTGPIGATPPSNPRSQQPASGPPRRIIVPNNSDSGE